MWSMKKSDAYLTPPVRASVLCAGMQVMRTQKPELASVLTNS